MYLMNVSRYKNLRNVKSAIIPGSLMNCVRSVKENVSFIKSILETQQLIEKICTRLIEIK